MKDLPDAIDALRSAFFPDRCCFCDKVVERKVKVCDNCKTQIIRIQGARCLACGNTKKNCRCKSRANFYDGITAPFQYKGIVRNGIALWKFRDAHRNVNFFAEMIITAINEAYGNINFDVITFVPQTQNESTERTYNQGEQLALAVGEKINTPVLPLLSKLYETERQHHLSPIQRSGNVFGVFECCDKEQVKGKTILIVDDIKTSGNTLNECAKMLHIYDAASVYCAVIAIA